MAPDLVFRVWQVSVDSWDTWLNLFPQHDQFFQSLCQLTSNQLYSCPPGLYCFQGPVL